MLALTVETRQYLNRSRFRFRERSQARGDTSGAAVGVARSVWIGVQAGSDKSLKPCGVCPAADRQRLSRGGGADFTLV
jgi:hypothetical protein